MITVDQTAFGFTGGNCFSACVASLLELRIDEVPYFMCEPVEEWYARFTDWLSAHGMWPMCLRADGERAPIGLHILSGLSPRAPEPADPQRHLHSVVARGLEIVHDPHPSRAGLRDRRDAIVLVPLDPAPPRGPAEVAHAPVKLRRTEPEPAVQREIWRRTGDGLAPHRRRL